MTHRLDFTYRGSLDETQTGLVKHIDRTAVWRGWALAARRERRGLIPAVLVLSAVLGGLMLVPSGLGPVLGGALLLAVYLPLAWLVTRVTLRDACPQAARVRRLHGWLERARAALPPEASIDVHARLEPDGCQGHQGSCGYPWMESYLFLPDGSTIEVRVTDGRDCPLARVAAPAGRFLMELDLAADDPNVLATMARQLARAGDPRGVTTRVVEPDGPYRLRWVLEQDMGAVGDELPVWPILRLTALRAALGDTPRLAAPAPASALPEPEASLVAPRWSRGHLGATPPPAQGVLLPLRQGVASLDEPGALAASTFWESMPSPSATLLAAGMVLNGLLAVAALAITQPLLHGAWMLVMALGVLFSLPNLLAVGWGVLRRRRHPEPRLAGAVEVDEDGLRIRGAEGRLVALDFSRPFVVHLTRARHLAPGLDRARVFLKLLQRDARGTLVRGGVTALIPASAEVRALPVKVEVGLPELDPESFAWLWRTLGGVASAHGELLPAIGLDGDPSLPLLPEDPNPRAPGLTPVGSR